MNQNPLKFVIVASTAGSVMNEVLRTSFFRSHVHSLVTDRQCAAIEKAEAVGLPVVTFLEETVELFCIRLLDYLQRNEIDYIFSYYTNFYSQKLRDAYQDRIINFHPSLLPAFKGMDGFGDTVAYFARFAGNTVEFIDQKMDEGKIIMQTTFPLDTTVPLNTMRHNIFVQQCQALLQVAKWLCDGRIVVNGRQVIIKNAAFDNPQFSPALDFEEAKNMTIPMPANLREIKNVHSRN